MEVFINNKHYIGYKNNYYKIENFTVTIDGKTPLMIALIDKDQLFLRKTDTLKSCFLQRINNSL